MPYSLTDHGIDVRTAMNGREGLSRLEEFTPSVIILDLMMPVMNGFEFLEHIQVEPTLRDIPVVVLTAKTPEPNEIGKLSKFTDFILTKGRDDDVRVIEATLKSVVPKRRL